jgi:hypothetical protein
MSYSANSWLDLSRVESFDRPFPHFVSPLALSTDASESILEWLEFEAPWKVVSADFYEQYEFSLWGVNLPPTITFLKDQSFLASSKRRVEEQFKIQLRPSFDLTAHKLVAGQTIRIHNDFIPGRETHRLLIQLNRKWNNDDGGLLLFFDGPEPSSVSKIFRPVHNSAIGFQISRVSNHAVSTIQSGERFTLVFSFYAEA